MAQDGQVNIALKITAENGGVQKVEQGLNRVSSAAKKTASESKSGFEQMQGAVSKVHGALGTLRNIITGFGIVGLIMPIVEAFKTWHDEIKRTEERAKALREELALKSAAAEVQAVAEKYRDLSDAIKAVSDSRAKDNELFNEEVRLRREAEDAASAAAEADALAGVDPNAEDADKQREAIRSRFAADRARTSADRKKADVVFRRQSLNQQAEDATSAADQLEANLSGYDKAILRSRTRASTLAALSNERNDKDGTWYDPRKRTEEGDAERDRLRKEADAERERSKQLEEQKKALEKQIADLRATATHKKKMSDVLYTGVETAETERATVTVNENTANAATAAKDAAEQKKKADEAAKLADAQRAQQLLSQQKAEVEAQIAAQQARKDAAGQSVYNAQNAYDLTVANGGNRSSQTSALQSLQSAQNAAQNVNHAADTAINALTETLNSVEARLKAAQSYLESQSKQQRNAWSEAPAGS